MVVHLATDHAGYECKELVKSWLEEEGFAVVDHGAYSYNKLDDYPDYISKAVRKVSDCPLDDRAIIFGGSGQGEAIMANRFPGVRAVVLYTDNEEISALSRRHNDANVLSIGARFLSTDAVKKNIWTWLHTDPLTDKKYSRRNQKIEKITKELYS